MPYFQKRNVLFSPLHQILRKHPEQRESQYQPRDRCKYPVMNQAEWQRDNHQKQSKLVLSVPPCEELLQFIPEHVSASLLKPIIAL